MVFKPGMTGNKAGRPAGSLGKVPSNKALRDSFKKNSDEAIKNVVSYMRDAESDVTREKGAMKSIISKMQGVTDPKELKELTSALDKCLTNKEKAGDRSLKASVKILDFTYNIVATEDRLKIQKLQLKRVDAEEDGDEEDIAPAISLKSVS